MKIEVNFEYIGEIKPPKRLSKLDKNSSAYRMKIKASESLNPNLDLASVSYPVLCNDDIVNRMKDFWELHLNYSEQLTLLEK